ncbi:hypothetical protein VTO42DRAFT_4011 [Malbranchea cinnamomea]
MEPALRVFSILIFVVLFGLARYVEALDLRYCSSLNTGANFDSVLDTFQSHGACSLTCGNDYAFAILQGKFCWCSNAAPANTVPSSRCNEKCPGFPDDQCGNTNEDLYAYILLNRKPSTTIGSVPQTSALTSTTETPPTSASPTNDEQPATITTTNEPTTSDSDSDGGSAISGGAIAGIVIGCLAGVAIIVGLLLWFFKRRKGQSKDDNFHSSFFERPVPRPTFQGTLGPREAALGDSGINGFRSGPTQRLSVPAFTDSRLKPDADIYPNGSRYSNVSLHDHQDYSRPVLRLTNPDPPEN